MPVFLIPLALFGGGTLAGYSLFRAADDTVDSVGNAAGKIALAVGVGMIAYLVLKKGKVL